MYSIIDQQWKKKDDTCMLFALYSAMTEKQKYVVTVCLSFKDWLLWDACIYCGISSMQMDGARKFVDVAKEAMGKNKND